MTNRQNLTTESGAPVADNQRSQTAGPAGPVLLQDQHLIEKLARFNRERIPERIVHARGSAAYGTFEVTADVTAYTRARFLSELGKRTETFTRFSTVAGGRGAPEAVRDPRGFAVKFYTEDGNYDLVGNNTPIFFIRDPLKFPDFIHSQKPDPFTNRQEPDNVWDFFSLSPEATHMFTWLFGDRGIPASYRHMNGYGSHTFQWVNAEGDRHWVKYHWQLRSGCPFPHRPRGGGAGRREPRVAPARPAHLHRDRGSPLVDPEGPDHAGRRRPHLPDQPLRPHQGLAPRRLSPDRGGPADPRPQPRQLLRRRGAGGLRPGPLRLGHRPEPRQDAPGPALRLRRRPPLPPRHQSHPAACQRPARHRRRTTTDATAPCASTTTAGRRRTTSPTASTARCRPTRPLYDGLAVAGVSGPYPTDERTTDNFSQAGALYRLIPEDAKHAPRRRHRRRPGPGLARDDIIERSVAHFGAADPDYGARLEQAVKARRA